MLKKERTHNSLWKTYDIGLEGAARATNTNDNNASGLIAKLHIPWYKANERDPEKQELVENELVLMRGPLAPLQGTVVPRLYGDWESVNGDRLVVLEDVGKQILSKEQQRDPDIQWVRSFRRH